MRVTGVPYVNEGEVRRVVDLLRDWLGSKFNDKYVMDFVTFLRIARYYTIFNSLCFPS